MARLGGKTVIITGAGTGIGRACLDLFTEEGARVFGIGLGEKDLTEAVAAVREAGGEAGSHVADLSRPGDAETAFQAALDQLQGVDVLVNAAGVGYSWRSARPHSMDDTVGTPPEDWSEVLSINLGSIFGLLGAPDAHAYTASKGAIINYTRSLCVAYASDGIRANTVCPGFVDTPMAASIMHWFDDPETAEAAAPMGRAATAREIAYSCLFLASEESSYCNGSMLVADGGHSAR